MRAAAVVAIFLFTPWDPAYAQTAEPPPCCQLDPGTPPESPAVIEERQRLWKILATGLAVLAVGQGVGFAYAAADGRPTNQFLAGIPLVGSIAMNARDAPQGGWRSGLAFSVLLQAAGVILVAASGTALRDLAVRPEISASRDGASLDLSTRF